jgi:hypothetical protein
MRILLLAAALLLPAVALAAGDAAPLRTGDVLPRVDGEFLTGRAVTLPDAASGKVAVLLMGFTYASRQPVEEWGAWCRKTIGADPGVTFFEMPMIGGLAKLGRWFIDSGMRRGTPAELHEHVITVYAKTGDWKTRLGVSGANDRDAFVVVLDRHGVVVWLHGGAFTEARANELTGLIARLQP